MALFGRIRRRLALAIVLTALIPVSVAVLLASSMVRQTSARFYVPEVGARLDQSLGLYQDLARAIKASMRHEATAIATRQRLRDAARSGDAPAAQRELAAALREFPNVVSLTVLRASGEPLAAVRREEPVDPEKENQLEVVRGLASPVADEQLRGAGDEPDHDERDQESDGPRLVAVFAADQARFAELEQMSQFVDTYKQIESRREADESSYVYAFAALLGITIVAAVGVGGLLARGISSRLGELAKATQRVGEGDLSIRVRTVGHDEITDLSKAFNRMVGEVETSRVRIEYLQRIAAWQEMARRLAHEIKNPLTPIQLAVQEVHRRYGDADPAFRKLLDNTLEIVEDEVGTLRRLVSEFSDFARLPQAELSQADLAEFLREQRSRLAWWEEDEAALQQGGDGRARADVALELELPEGPAPALLDGQMLGRALINLVRNAGQALAEAGSSSGVIRIRLTRDGDYHVLEVDDNGPGIPPALQNAVFDPYVTTKSDGTGLGLAIVKKIVVEHGGTIAAGQSTLGGARMRLRLPVLGSHASRALAMAEWQAAPSSSRPPLRRSRPRDSG